MLGFNILLADWYNLRLVQARVQLPRKTKARLVAIFVILGTSIAFITAVFFPRDDFQFSQEPRTMDKQLIDLRNFEITSNNTICQRQESALKLLQICIHSSRQNYNRRAAIRSSWGSVKTLDVQWLNSNKIQDNFYCYVLRGYAPWRSKRYKFYISKDEYKPKKFPDYCSGMGYITRPTMMRKIFDVSKRTRYLWVEDLFSTGILTKYYNEEIAYTVEPALEPLDDNTNSSNHETTILLKDISKLYLNEQYAAYKQWINDNTQNTNRWLFILLENKNEQLLSLEQRSLWQKTAAEFESAVAKY
ncbi:unnamed protein product [Allacma fusca]|uniref:Hexosyltransferase n=1 Tax=Allacma fusca TaxID=39272 RepID=A0A8J2LE99_9HEXA|nr:unnamed protein product [Allacma fusca]